MSIPDAQSVQAFRDYTGRVRSKGTARAYAVSATHFLEFMRGRRYGLDTLPPGAMSEFAAWLAARGLSPASVRSFVIGAGRYLRWLRGTGLQITALATPDLPVIPTKAPRALTDDELMRYLNAAMRVLGEPLRTVAVMLPYCGLRSAEMLALRVADVQREDVGGRQRFALRVALGKGGKERLVPLLEQAYPTLKKYLAGPRTRVRENATLLFCDGRGAHVGERRLRRALEVVSRASGVAATAHTLRRTYLTGLHRLGVPDTVLAAIAGHASVATTQRSYLAIDPQTIWRAIDRAHQGART